MLTTIKNPRFSYVRRLIALPVACILTILFAVQCRRPHEDAKTLSRSDKVETANAEKGLKEDSTTAGQPLPDNVLYIIDGIEASKKEAEELKGGEIKSINVLKQGDVAIKEYGDKGVNGVILVFTHRADATNIVTDVEQPATFPGGTEGWRRYLSSNLKYPEAAQEKGTQGVVRIQMTVDTEGRITEMKALNDPGDGLAAEALRVIKYGPKWVPALQNGKAVTYRFVQTITFQLQ